MNIIQQLTTHLAFKKRLEVTIVTADDAAEKRERLRSRFLLPKCLKWGLSPTLCYPTMEYVLC